MEMPLELLLKSREHLEIARLQDEVVSRLYSIDTGLTFHGGTSVWRCYGGKRFSYDLDLYVKNNNEIKRLMENISRYGLFIKNLRQRKGGKVLSYYSISNGRATITLEFNQKRFKNAIIGTYTRSDGSKMDIYTLSPEDLITEKISAYTSRKAIKDLYDIFTLVHVVDVRKTRKEIYEFITAIKRPLDEKVLPSLIYDGPVPDFLAMVEYIKRRYEIR